MLRADDWPQHLGPRRDGSSNEAAPEPWPEGGPEVVWRREIGRGFAAPSVAGDRLFLFHRVGNEVRLDCLRSEDGEPVWSYRADTAYRDDFGFSDGPRAAPTVAGDKVFVFGADGRLAAVDRASGELRWSLDTHERFAVRKGFFGASASPLVLGDRLFLNVGGRDASLIAFDTRDGNALWTAGTDSASYASAVPLGWDDRPAVLFFTREGLAVTAVDDGEILATFHLRAQINSSVNAATPLVLGDRIFASASYGAGAALLEPRAGGLEPVWESDDVMSSHYSTSVAHDGLLFGFHGRQEYRAALRAVEIATGKVRWSVDRFGTGSITRVGDHLLVLREDGRLFLAPASGDAFSPLAEATVLEATVRALPAYADGVLYAHNERELVALRLR
jgi:outer membrane protein assembly factor BamB